MTKYTEELIAEINNNIYRQDYIDLAGNNLNNQQAIHLAEALKRNQYIKTVLLSDNKIGDAGVEALATVKTLETLYVAQNKFGSDGIQALSRSNLHELNVRNNNVGDSITYFSGNKTLKLLDASECKITSDGAIGLAKGDSGLTQLFLEHNKIDDKGAKALLSIKSLSKLDLAFNEISSKDFMVGTHIKELYINNNPCSLADGIEIDDESDEEELATLAGEKNHDKAYFETEKKTDASNNKIDKGSLQNQFTSKSSRSF